jgi:hypothetical protein
MPEHSRATYSAAGSIQYSFGLQSPTPVAFAHTLFSAPLIWSRADKRRSGQLFRFSSFIRTDSEVPEVYWQKTTGGALQEYGLPDLEAPNLTPDYRINRPLGIAPIDDLDVLKIDPLMGPRIRAMFDDGIVDVAFTMKEFLEGRGVSIEHFGTITQRKRGCRLIALIRPSGAYADNYIEFRRKHFGKGTHSAWPSLAFIEQTFLDRQDGKISYPRRDHFCAPAESNSLKQAKRISWLQHPGLLKHEVKFTSFGCLWGQVSKLFLLDQSPADLVYFAVREPLATWLRHFWAKECAGQHSEFETDADAREFGDSVWLGSDQCEYNWSVEVALDAVASSADVSTILPQASMDMMVRTSYLKNLQNVSGSATPIDLLMLDLQDSLSDYKTSADERERSIAQTAAYLSMPMGRCARALDEIEFEIEHDLNRHRRLIA